MNNRPIIKFCGLTRPEDVETALALGANYLGFIVAAKSPRRVSASQAGYLSFPAKGLAKTVAVTVNPTNKLISEISREMRPDFVQLHGDESPARSKEVKDLSGVGIIKALPIADKTDLGIIPAYQGVADYILLDAKPPKGEAVRGGHGVSFDWSLLKNIVSETPVILAGGLCAENIKAARQTGLRFFDVSSGIESEPGIKDALKMRALMEAAHE